MNEKYLAINAGSSSLKFSLFEVVVVDGTPKEIELVNGIVEKIGDIDSSYTLKFNGKKVKQQKYVKKHSEAVEVMLKALLENHFINSYSDISGVGHRVLHGGELYSDSVLIDDKVIQDIKDLTRFGPLHHPGQLAGIIGTQEVLPNVPQVAVFDTAYHQTMPKENYLYAIPYELYKELGIRKYGFHGISYKYIAGRMCELLGKDEVNLVACHIGSGASVCCIKENKSYDTSMGLTPLDGLVMGTRCGSIDVSIVDCMCKEHGLTLEQAIEILNTKSGLLGLCGKNDWRDVLALAQAGDEKAILAVNKLESSIVKYIGHYIMELNGKVDGIVFTAGIGENSAELRSGVINRISGAIETQLDEELNKRTAGFRDRHEGIISKEGSRYNVYTVPTNEELMIVRDTYRICKGKEDEKHTLLKASSNK